MYIKKLNVEDFENENKIYNASLKTLIKNIFETEGLGEVGYVLSESTRIYPPRFVNIPDHPKKIKKLVRKTFKAKIHPNDPHKIKVDIRF